MNRERYSDHTAELAIGHVMKEERRKKQLKEKKRSSFRFEFEGGDIDGKRTESKNTHHGRSTRTR